MADAGILTYSPLMLKPDPSRTVIRPFSPSDPEGFENEARPRAQRIVDRVLSLDDAELHHQLDCMMTSLAERHRNVEDVMLRRHEDLRDQLPDKRPLDRERKILIGAFFSEEYSFEAAALFNPSMVSHPEQGDAPEGTVRFLLSLRGIGEGHISSVTFRTGTWSTDAGFAVDAPSRQAVSPRIEAPDQSDDAQTTRIVWEAGEDVTENVLFPVTPSQRQGVEDLRLTRFVEEDGGISLLGTYTAFDGLHARSELLRGTGLHSLSVRPLDGDVARSKGMALFPRKIGGRYMMLGRQDSESIWLTASDDITTWNGGAKLVSPKWPWEFVQMGNCGSPIEIDEGWLLLTHGVGMARNYSMGACLLDREDPSKVLARMRHPLLEPSPTARDGYVPNVVYSCGAMVHGRTLLLPYGVADNYTSFASAGVDAVLEAME